MIDSLLGLFIWMQNPNEWREQVYEKKYNQTVWQSENKQPKPVSFKGNVSWYASGKYKDGTEFKGDKLTCACYRQYRGRTFRVTYKDKSVDVLCDDSGAFESNGSGRLLDLSVRSFEVLAPRSIGILKDARIEILI